MYKYKKFWFPENDKETPPAVNNEWKQKGKVVLSFVKNKNVVVQAGANAGFFPINLAKSFHKVITFEPIPYIWDCLVKNINDRPHIDNITFYNKGVGSQNSVGSQDLKRKKNSGASSIKYDVSGNIEIVTIDSLELEGMDLLWLDIEGFEVEALIGAKKTIQKYKPVIVLENKGLIKGWGGDLNGSKKLVRWMKTEFNYNRHTRLMRDDVYIPE